MFLANVLISEELYQESTADGCCLDIARSFNWLIRWNTFALHNFRIVLDLEK